MGMILREAEVVYKGKRIEASRKISSSRDAAQILKEWGLHDKAQECFVVLYLNAKHQCLAVQMVGLGTLTATLVHPREVFRGAILAGAQAVIVAHNHPSGNTTPSPDDLDLTNRLKAAGDLIGIPVLDHLIVSLFEGYNSLAESGQI